MTQVLAGIGGTVGGLDLEDTELVVRSAMHRLGASLLESTSSVTPVGSVTAGKGSAALKVSASL